MTTLRIRKLPFAFDDTVPFAWHPTNPDFARLTNAIGMLAIAFERYIVTVIKRAKAEISDPEVAAEARGRRVPPAGDHARPRPPPAHRRPRPALPRPGQRPYIRRCFSDGRFEVWRR